VADSGEDAGVHAAVREDWREARSDKGQGEAPAGEPGDGWAWPTADTPTVAGAAAEAEGAEGAGKEEEAGAPPGAPSKTPAGAVPVA